MNKLIMPHNVGVKNVLENMKEVLALYKNVIGCYRLIWPDQKIYRGKLKDLAKIVHDNHLTLTTMLVVGEAIDSHPSPLTSRLYNKHFTHLFRKGDDDTNS